MNLIRYNTPEIASPIHALRDHFNRLFELTSPARATEAFGDWAPALDALEDKDKYTVSVELPGLKREDIQVTVHEGVLTISGERKSERDVKDGVVHRTERSYGKFSRSLSLPSAVRADKVSASYKDGILTVDVPKAEEAKPKTIEVKVS